jgi:hypothetical protein
MNESSIQLWQWVRHGRSISVCRIENIAVEPGRDEETVRLRLATVEALWGAKPAEERRASFERPVTPAARIKVQIPVWGHVELRAGSLLLYVADGPAPDAKPLFAANTAADDPSLSAVRQVTAFEREHAEDADARERQYLDWLGKGRMAQRMFAGEALTRDPFAGVDRDGKIASAVAEIVADESAEPFLRISALEWLNDRLWPKTNAAGKAAGIRAEAKAMSAKDANVRQFAHDAVIDLDPLRLRQDGVADASAAALLRQRAAALQEPGRTRLETLAEAITPRR